MEYKLSADGLLEIEDVVVTKMSIEHIDSIILATRADKAQVLARVAELDALIDRYESLKSQALALGVVAKDPMGVKP